MNPKVAGLLGFARKGKKLVSGEAAAEAALKKGQAKLVILAEDISPNLQKRYTHWCRDEGVPLVSGETKLKLGLALGLSPRTVIVVTDENFAKSIIEAGGFSQKHNGF